MNYPTVILIGGGSGTGKSTLTFGLAKSLQYTTVQIDDLQICIEQLVERERLPQFYDHYDVAMKGGTHDEIARAVMAIGDFFTPAVAEIVSWRTESRLPTIIEGDFVTPELASRYDRNTVGALFLIDTLDGIESNYMSREGDHQEHRAAVSSLVCGEVRRQCHAYRLPVIEARPHATLVSRALNAVECSRPCSSD